jgi:outer membrane lipopolysaccharide assembly protein LptE/RlpB
MNKLNSFILVIFVIFSISSCGYQLRGSIDIEGLENVNIISDKRNNITRILQQKLSPYQKDNFNKSKYPSIRILSIDINKRQLSVNSSGRVDEYEINKTIKYEFIYSEKDTVTGVLKSSASYDFNESQMQGTRERENIAIGTIDQNLARKILLKFKAGLKANST